MITHFNSGMSPPDTSGELGGAISSPVGAAAFSFSAAYIARFQTPGPSLATGMSSDPANAGGDHEEVTSDFETSLDEKPTAIVSTSLTAASAIDGTRHSGTAPGECAPELDIFGGANSETPMRKFVAAHWKRQAPVSASSPVLIGANSISLVLHRAHGVSVHRLSVDSSRFDFAHDGQCCERDAAECEDSDQRQLIVKHRAVSISELDAENTG